MKHNLLYVSCPICGKQFVDLALLGEGRHEYWCDRCFIDINIVITESEEGE